MAMTMMKTVTRFLQDTISILFQHYYIFYCLHLTNSFKTDRDKEQEEIAAQEAQEEMAQQEMDNDLCMQNEIDAEIDMTMNEAMNDCAD